MSQVIVATTAMQVEFNKQANLARYMKFIDDAAKQDAMLIVFPEQSLQGYLHNVGQWRPETVEYQHKNAEIVPEGESIQQLARKAQEKNIYIVFGMTEAAPDEGDAVLYNTTVLLGPEGFIGRYRKTHQPLDECHVYYPGNGWSVFDIGFAKVGLLTCYDKVFPESCRELALQGAEILILSTAWPLFAPGADPKTDYAAYLADILDRVRAAENQVWFISSNIVGMHGDHQYFGNSRIVYPNGMDYAEIPYMEEGLLIRNIDVQSEVIKARTLSLFGLSMIKDRRPSAYTHIAQK